MSHECNYVQFLNRLLCELPITQMHRLPILAVSQAGKSFFELTSLSVVFLFVADHSLRDGGFGRRKMGGIHFVMDITGDKGYIVAGTVLRKTLHVAESLASQPFLSARTRHRFLVSPSRCL